MSINVKDVGAITKAVLTADEKANDGRTSYLRALVGAVQDEVGGKGKDRDEQLTALRTVHEQFYEVVLEVAEGFIPKHTKERGTRVQEKGNFARTAASALRRYIAGGGDVSTLKATTVTKGYLRAKTGPAVVRPRSVRVLRGQVERRAEAIIESVRAIAALDRDEAAAELRRLVHLLNDEAASLTTVVRGARPAKAHGQTQVIPPGTFRPSDTTILKAQARAA